jgi:heavy metal translocating P-type ATPase
VTWVAEEEGPPGQGATEREDESGELPIEPFDAMLDFANDVLHDARGGLLVMQRVESGRIRVKAARDSEDELAKLLSWLATRPEVLRVSRRPKAGIVEVSYRDEAGIPGSFARSLSDRLFLLNRPPPGRPRIDLIHALAGRARLRVTHGDADAPLRLASWLETLSGVLRASASPASHSVLVTLDPLVRTPEELLAAARSSEQNQWPEAPTQPRRTGWRLTLANTAVLGATLSGVLPVPAAGVAAALTALPSAGRALRAAKEKRVSVDLLDLAAIGISIGTGQPVTAAFITWLLGIGDLLLEQTSDRARTAISKLMKLDADTAWRLRPAGSTLLPTSGGPGAGRSCEGEVEHVSARRLSVGDLIVVEAGGRVAADGVVLRGMASVDEKALTGESMPRERGPGDRVLAATVVVDGQIVVEVERTGTDTTAAKIVQILEGAGAKPMTLQRDAERVADRLVLPTFGVAGAAGLLAAQIDRVTSVLITDFGTGIRIAIPTSALTGMTLAARRGILVKGAQYLERLSRADVVVFDKTGTLTGGEPEIIDVAAVGVMLPREAIAFATAAEARQSHPIAEAIRRYAAQNGVIAPDAELGSESYAIGRGVCARVRGHAILVGSARLMADHGMDPARSTRGKLAMQGHAAKGASSLFVAIDGEIAVVIGYADTPRAESREVVKALQADGRRQIILMSGDARASVDAVARSIGIDQAFAEMLPEDKAEHVRSLQRAGRVVAMIGDGINDAPALAVADVGVSLDGGTDVALETADVVLLDGGLRKLPDAFLVADDAMRRVKRGLGLVIAPNAAAIVLAALGLMTPGAAAIVNNGSTVAAALAAALPLLGRTKPRRA